VTPQDWAISAMVNWRALYMRWALLIRWGHLGFAAAGATTGAGGDQTRLGAFLDESGLVLGHQGEHAEDEAPVGGGGVHDAVGQRPDPDPAALQGGDDVDEVAQVAAEPVNFPKDQGVAAAQVGQAGVHCGRSALVPVAVSVSV